MAMGLCIVAMDSPGGPCTYGSMTVPYRYNNLILIHKEDIKLFNIDEAWDSEYVTAITGHAPRVGSGLTEKHYFP